MENEYDIIFDTTFMVGVGLCEIPSMFQNKNLFCHLSKKIYFVTYHKKNLFCIFQLFKTYVHDFLLTLLLLLTIRDVFATRAKNVKTAKISHWVLQKCLLWRIKPKIPNV